MIPLIDITPLFDRAGAARDATDAAILAAATQSGFMTVRGDPAVLPATAATRARLLRVFALPPEVTRALWRQKFDPSHPNIYRGWAPKTPESGLIKDSLDLGPDIAYPDRKADPSDPLLGATPLPPEDALPGWRADIAAYYIAMEALGQAMLRSVARGLGLGENFFDASFAGGNSTLRFIRYVQEGPASLDGVPPAQIADHQGVRRRIVTGAHVDSGFVTLLAHDGVEGLQAQTAEGGWLDVPPREGTIAVNFGGVLERWTSGRIRATRHRVLDPGRTRHSIPFFYEPRVDAVIAPMPGQPAFAPFLYGDHVWAAMMGFADYRGLEALRPPRGLPRVA